MGNDLMDYHFKLDSITDFSCKLELDFKSRQFDWIAQAAQAQRPGFNSFELNDRFYHRLEQSLNSTMQGIKKEVMADKIEILRWRVTRCHYQKTDAGTWKMQCDISGEYADRR